MPLVESCLPFAGPCLTVELSSEPNCSRFISSPTHTRVCADVLLRFQGRIRGGIICNPTSHLFSDKIQGNEEKNNNNKYQNTCICFFNFFYYLNADKSNLGSFCQKLVQDFKHLVAKEKHYIYSRYGLYRLGDLLDRFDRVGVSTFSLAALSVS